MNSGNLKYLHKLLHPSQTRWPSLAAVVKRILEQWSALQLFFTSKLLDERVLTVEHIYQALHDPFSKLYFMFLNHVLPKITTLNQYFQSEKVIIFQMHAIMTNSHKELIMCYIQRQYMTTGELSIIDPTDANLFLPKVQIYLGIDVFNAIKKPEILERPELLNHFYERCQQFYSVLCTEIRKRYQLDDPLLSKLFIFSPENAISHQICEQYPSLGGIMSQVPRLLDPNSAQSINNEWRLLPIYHFSAGQIVITDEIK